MKDVIGILSLIKAKDLISFVLLHFTTAIMIYYFVVKLFGVRYKWGKLLLAAFFYAAAMTLIRKVYAFYGIPLGTHTLYLIIIKAGIFVIFLRLKIYEAILGSIFTSLLILAATPVNLEVIKILKIDFSSFSDNPWLFSLVGHIEGMFLMIAVAILALTKLNVYKAFNWGDENE